MSIESRRKLRPYLAVLGVFSVVTVALIPLHSSLRFATVALLYLLVVFLAALWLGRGPSITASVLSFLALNYFFTVPYRTFRVESTQDVISLLVFLFVAEMTSRLVTQLREREAKAAEAEILRNTDELKSALLSAVSHELRTPLASIRIAATGLLHENLRARDDARQELLEMIDTEAARLSRLVGNLLDLSRIEAGVLRPDKEWRDLQEVVGRAVDYLQTRLRGHQVIVEIPDELPLVPLDFTQIEDVLVNLLDNAIRHSPEGSTIRINALQKDSAAVVVRVENEGPPIPFDIAGQIFDRFYRAHRDGRGIGLGLAICKGLVEAHGGRIWVERPGEPGARFAFSLPLEGAEDSMTQQQRQEAQR